MVSLAKQLIGDLKLNMYDKFIVDPLLKDTNIDDLQRI